MASFLPPLEISVQSTYNTPEESTYSLKGLGYDHVITLTKENAHVGSKKVIERNAGATVVSFDLELHNNVPSLYIFAWKTDTLLARESEPPSFLPKYTKH